MGRKRNENSNIQRKKENQNSEKSNSIPSFRILSCSSLMSGLAKSRYVLNLTCLILDFDKEKEKKRHPCRRCQVNNPFILGQQQQQQQQQPRTHFILRLCRSPPNTLRARCSSHSYPITAGSASLYPRLFVSPEPSQPCSTAHSSRIRKRASIGWFPNASMAAEKSFGRDQADIRSIRTTRPLRAHCIHARLHDHLHVDQTDHSRR